MGRREQGRGERREKKGKREERREGRREEGRKESLIGSLSSGSEGQCPSLHSWDI